MFLEVVKELNMIRLEDTQTHNTLENSMSPVDET